MAWIRKTSAWLPQFKICITSTSLKSKGRPDPSQPSLYFPKLAESVHPEQKVTPFPMIFSSVEMPFAEDWNPMRRCLSLSPAGVAGGILDHRAKSRCIQRTTISWNVCARYRSMNRNVRPSIPRAERLRATLNATWYDSATVLNEPGSSPAEALCFY